jgi:dipeptidyl aminopeptidase/acylaminoacyl peptidase
MLIIHGTRDAAVSFHESEHFYRELLRLGVRSELLVVPDAPHSFDLRPPQMDLRPVVLDFLERNLRVNGK